VYWFINLVDRWQHNQLSNKASFIALSLERKRKRQMAAFMTTEGKERIIFAQLEALKEIR